MAVEGTGVWLCPACRGSCGPGCFNCCMCSGNGLCGRKHFSLPPVGQGITRKAKQAGFPDAHDYEVHLNTGETAEQIAARKREYPWVHMLEDD